MMQNFFVLISKCNIVELDFWLSWLIYSAFDPRFNVVSLPFGQRKSGVEKVLGENQITLESGCVKCGNFTLESGYEKAKELFTEHPDVDTLICATDTMAVGAANWLKENGYQIPQQVQIAGMGDSFLGKIIEPKLTTVHFFYKTSGMESAKVLVDLIESKETSSVHKEIKMGCKVVLRESHRNI